MTPYNEIFTLNQEGLNHSQIEKALGTVTRKTIISALKLAETIGFRYNSKDALSDADIHHILHPKKDKATRMPDMAQVMFELSLPGASIASVWKSYIEQCPVGYSKTKFQALVKEYGKKYNIGEYMQLVYLRYIKDAFRNVDGTCINCLFAQIHQSKKVFVVIIRDNKARSWIHGLISLIHQIGGAPSSFTFLNKIPKPLRAITQDALSYYGIRIEPNSNGVESELKQVIQYGLTEISSEHIFEGEQTSPIWILQQACLRYNSKPMAEGSVLSPELAFSLEARCFQCLPDEDYDLTEYVHVRVQPNRHIEIDGNYYSVPFEYRHENLTAYISDQYIDICYLDTIICTHERLNGKNGKYSTDREHLVPDAMVPFGELSGKSLRSWAKKIGQNTERVIDYLLRIRAYEIQGYKICDTILHFSSKYGSQALEEACATAISTRKITYSFIAEYCKNHS